MCGLTGFLDCTQTSSRDALLDRVQRMARSLRHRGPDGEGLWADEAAGVALGFRRLAIVDLSPAGSQPMLSHSGRFTIVFNGEVYNAPQLRLQLQQEGCAPAFRGHSDTETMLACIEAWGLEAALRRFIGMFAVALWDRQERRLTLVRDRLGVKPLYYAWCGATLLFGSELKALRMHPAFDAGIDRQSLTALLRRSYIPCPRTIYAAARKLPPGTLMHCDPHNPGHGSPAPYWSAEEAARTGLAHPFGGTFAEAADQLDALLRDAVGLRMVSDVPLGVFLSGGIDSSVVAAQMQAQSPTPVKTFSIGFDVSGYNEAEHARLVAAHLGTDHTELVVSPRQAMEIIPRLPSLYDEPFADSSQIPTFLVSEMARKSVTVSLSGDGGDELFGGYERYIRSGAWSRLRRIPGPLRAGAAAALLGVPPHAWDRTLTAASPLLPRRLRFSHPGDKLAKLGRMMAVETEEAMYHSLTAAWRQAPTASASGDEDQDLPALPPETEIAHRMMLWDTVTYLPDDILVKVDRASMGVSLEAREPLLDHRLLEFAWSLPLEMKVERGEGKRVLREVLYRYVPRTLIDRPKMGFSIPLGDWLRGPLRDWAECLLAPDRLRSEGWFDERTISTCWREHLEGRRNGEQQLWPVLMFQSWIDTSAEGLPRD